MLAKPPIAPTGIVAGKIGDGANQIGVLTVESDGGQYNFAINLQAAEVIIQAMERIRSDLLLISESRHPHKT